MPISGRSGCMAVRCAAAIASNENRAILCVFVSVYVCVCVYARARERVRACACVHVAFCVHVWGGGVGFRV